MGVREIDRFLEQWEMNAKDLHRRLILAPTPPGTGTLARHLAAGPGLDGIGHGGGAGPGSPHDRAMGVSLRRGRAESLIFEQTGGSPRPRRGGASGCQEENLLWWTRPARVTARRPVTIRRCAWRLARWNGWNWRVTATQARRRHSWPISGLSPRLRGNPLWWSSSSTPRRSIPAPAGEPSQERVCTCCKRVYPRACGGTGRASRSLRLVLGLSPRLRGNPLMGCQTAAW